MERAIRSAPQQPTIVCPGCESRSITSIGAIPDGYTFAGRLLDERIPGGTLYRCAECRLGFKWPRLSKSELSKLYQRADSAVWEYEPATRRDWVIARDVLEARVGSGKILDVGCFDGAFLRYLCKSTDDWEPFGVEINDDAARLAASHGVRIVGSDADDVDTRATYDAAVAFDLIEHLGNPAHFLESLARPVRPGGLIILSTGNLDAFSWRLMGSRYWYCVLPEHLSFISPAWCGRVSDELGLTVRSIETFSHSGSSDFLVRVAEAVKNVAYRILPGGFRLLRRVGMGGVDLSLNPALADTPPVWMSAKDHFLVVFQKSDSDPQV